MEANIKKNLTRLITLALLLVSISLPLGAYNNLNIIRGTVGAVGVVLDDDGDPILAEYSASGNYVRDVSVPGGTETNDLIIYSGEAYRGLYTAAQNLLETYPGSRIMSKSQYDSQSFSTHTQTPQVIRKPRLIDPDTKSVLLIDERQMLVTNPPYEGFILHEFPVDLSPGVGQALPNNIVSLLINKQGVIIFRSSNDIAYKIDVFERDGDTRILDEDGFFIPTFPLEMVAVTAGDVDIMPMGGAATDEKGRYVMPYTIPPCPGFFYQAKVPIIAMTPLTNFNPKSDGSTSYNPALFWDYASCIGYGDRPIGFNLMAQSAQITAKGIVASMGTPVHNLNLNFSTMQLAAIGTLAQVELSDTTQYQSDDTPIDPLAVGKYNFDFDGDGTTDIIRINAQDNTKLDIYLGDNDPNNNPDAVPDLTRLADYDLLQQLNDQGLLKTISKTDLEDTDIYIYRNSTGQLIGQMEGLVERDNREEDDILLAGSNNNSPMLYKGVHEDEPIATFGFASLLLGASSFDLISGLKLTDSSNRRPWMSPQAGSATSFANDRQPDFMRPGEIVKIVAINRATGYMGSADARLSENYIQLETFIQLGPPNLKVIATRTYKDKAGLTKDELHQNQLIGSEGAGLTSDQYIKIQTIWLDHKGNPLPENLPGYTGRVAISTGSQTEDFSGNFEIKPGYQTEVVQLNNAADLSTQHFYVQVIGENFDGNPSFESPGAGPGKLATRPKKYTPIKVPVFNEMATQEAQQVLIKATQDGVQNLPDEVQPVYHWVYRPEMQFSVYDFKVNEIRQEIAQNEFVDIYAAGADDSADTVPVLSSDYDITDILYDLTGKDTDQLLDLFGPDRELILAIGEQETNVTATLNQQGNIEFENLDHLGQLAVEDYLSIRLYQNNDAFNVLWEFAFEYLIVEPATIGYPNQTEDVYYVTADEPVVPLKAEVVGYALRDQSIKDPITLDWRTEGGGSLLETSQTDDEYGVFDNTVTLSTTKGDTATVYAKLHGADIESQLKQFEVLAGAPSSITVAVDGQAIALEQGEVRLDITIYDQFGNRVEDGTPIDIDFGDALIVKEQQISTVDGEGYIVLTGGEYTVPDTIVSIKSLDAETEIHLSVQGLNIALTASQVTLEKKQTVTLSANVTKLDGSAVTDVPVSFTANRGMIKDQYQLTNASGTATTTFTAGLNRIDDSWTAQVGLIATDTLSYSVTSASGNSVDAAESMLVADESVAGTISYASDGIPIEIAYETQAIVNVEVASQSDVQIGDMSDPNLEPLISLPMNELLNAGTEQSLLDAHGLNHATTLDVSIVNDHPFGAGRSADFNTGSSATISGSPLFNLTQNVGFRLDVKPQGDGSILNHGSGTQVLSYQSGLLTYQVVTEIGTYSVSANNIAFNHWHEIAARINGSSLELYVDGTTYTATVEGSLQLTDASNIVLGGAMQRLRGLRWYDLTSQPLIAFVDDTVLTPVATGAHALTVKSLGNLGTRVAGSQLKQLRVAITSNGEKNYISLLTKAGYEAVSSQYLDTVSPQTPVALNQQYQQNPLPGIVPSAYAWTWSGVWDGVKSTVGFLIPYEDFIVIAEQLGYLINRDWENFSPSKLAFAAIGAATILPMAKPLKPLLIPVKRFVNAMERFPASRFFAGAIGTAVKLALSGRTEKIANILPFVLLAIEIYDDPQVFTFIMDAIESEDDLWVWIDFVGSMVTELGGLSDLAVNEVGIDNQIFAENPLPEILLPQAHASLRRPRRVIADHLIEILTPSISSIASPAKVTKMLRVMKGELSDPNNAVWKNVFYKSGKAIKSLARVGSTKVRAFVRDSKNWRVNRFVALFALAYILEEHAKEQDPLKLSTDPTKNKNRMITLIANVFSHRLHIQQGALFHMTQIFYYRVMNQVAGGFPIKGIEEIRPAWRVYKQTDGTVDAPGNPYNRNVDIVLDNQNGGEEWIEVKSLRGPFYDNWFRNTLEVKKSGDANSEKYRSYYRQFFHDMRLNSDFVNEANLPKILNPKNLQNSTASTNANFHWFFHAFNPPRGSTDRSPTTSDLIKAKKLLCKAASGVSQKSDFYYQNFKDQKIKAVHRKCTQTVNSHVALRTPAQYGVEFLRQHMQALDIEDYVGLIQGLPY